MNSPSSFRWYVVQARSNYEKVVAQALRDRIAQSDIKELFGEVLVPCEDVVEMKNGQKRSSERKFFPGYVLVQMSTTLDQGRPQLTSECWHLVKSTPKVLGFIGGTADRPLPMSDAEATRLLARVEQAAEKPSQKVLFEKGQLLRVTEGPFNDFNAVVEDVDYDKGMVRASVSIFGRSTPVDFHFAQIERA